MGKMPEPDLLYVAFGTMGTAAGLALGLKAAGMKTRVVPVKVVDDFLASPEKYAALFRSTMFLMRSSDPSFPECDLSAAEMDVRGEFFGPGYARFTPEGLDAVELAGRLAGVKLEGTYTGKAFAALVHDARKGLLGGKTVLFWNTYNSTDISSGIAGADYHSLPRAFHRYFTPDVQTASAEP
jgi:D-cysteine desulfhydrase